MNRMKGGLAGIITAALLVSGSGLALAQAPADKMARHSVEGEVTRGRREEGLGPREDVRRHDDRALPADGPADDEEGDRITVSLGLKDNGPAPK